MFDIVKVKLKSKIEKLKGKVNRKCRYCKCSEIWGVNKTNVLKSRRFHCSGIFKWKKAKSLTYGKWKWKVKVKSESEKLNIGVYEVKKVDQNKNQKLICLT